MEVKSIENLNMDECREYLQKNPNDEMASKVQNRLHEIFAAREKQQQKAERTKDAERKASINLKNKWIDINQLLENKKYRNLHGVRIFFVLIFFLCLFFVFSTLYYTNSTHLIYSASWREQCNNVYGLENILLNLEFISMRYWYDSQTNFPIWDSYRLGGTFGLLLLIGGFSLVLFLITTLNHSSLIGKIYNIEDGTQADKFRPIQNNQGKCGLCQLGWTRLTKLLPFQYDIILVG